MARMIACWITKATNTLRLSNTYFDCNSDCADAPLWYINTHIAYLVYDFFPDIC